MRGDVMDRRSLLRIGTSAFFGALVARSFAARTAVAGQSNPTHGKACILLWLNGGPSHVDTFDPKPGRAPGMKLSQHLPLLAERGDKLAVLRGIASKEGNHARAQYYVHTGYTPTPTVIHPALGAWVCARLGDSGAELPAFVSIGGPSLGAGFLGVQNGPFVVQKAGAAPADVDLPPDVDTSRFERRLAALDAMEAELSGATGDAKIESRRQVYSKAVRLMRSPRLDAFDLTGEGESTRRAYGDTDFGRGCLVARRLVERGVRFVEVVLDGWDTHQNGFERSKKLMATLDPAFAALLDDLTSRALLASTLVVCLGEFGRTPRINANEGRDHWPQAWAAVLAGGGVRGGIVHGSTDEDGAAPAGTPTIVPDLLATMATAIGLDPAYTVTSPAGRPISVTDGGTPIRSLLERTQAPT
jgi:uncharacterized protein (DUF1501 family)